MPTTAAEPQPAALPLPGGRRGATVRLHPLLAGEFRAPPAYLHREHGSLGALRALGVGVRARDLVPAPVGSFLLEHPVAGPVLVDSGLHPSVAVDPRQNLGPLGPRVFRDLTVAQDDTAPAQLRARGYEPADVRAVVMTHLHLDHASAVAQFLEAPILVDGIEWDVATAPGALRHGYVRAQLDHALDWRTLDFDAPEAGSFATFGRSLDLFGDGSVRLVSTPGHTHGHLSVIVRLAEREALLTGDAIYTLRTLRETLLPARFADEHRFRRSLRELQLYVRETPDALVIPGHDIGVWRGLERVYA